MSETKKMILGGLWGTCLMTIFLDLATRFGKLNLDFASMLAAGTFLKPVFQGSALWWYGLAIHFLIGTFVLPFAYGRVFRLGATGPGALRGLQFGVFLWFVFMFFVMPMMGKNFFATATPRPLALNLWVLAAHLIYGFTLGTFCGTKAARAQSAASRAIRA